MTEAGKARSTIRQHHAILSGALGQAVKWGWCPLNAATMASPPTVHQRGIVPPSPEEVRAIVELAEQRNPILAALIMLAALTGARRGELCALKWGDVDLHTGTVRIARSILDLPGRVEEKATKSHQERTIALGEAGVVLLRLHRDGCVERAQMGEVELGPDTYVFSDRIEGSTPVRPDAVTGFFRRVSTDLLLPEVHLHSLRHFMATQLASRGDVSPRTLAGRLGHADASVSLKVYSAFFPPADVEAAEHVGRLLSRSQRSDQGPPEPPPYER
jgi:integrase